MKNSARGNSPTGSELKAVEDACREASRTVEPCDPCVSVVIHTESEERQRLHPQSLLDMIQAVFEVALFEDRCA